MRIPEIIPECYIDTAIVESLMNTDGVNHQKGCNNVARTMQTARHLKDSFAIGIIDKDKRKPSYVQQFTQLGKTEHIELMRHREKNHFIIRIIPAMDAFIMDTAAKENISLDNYNLPTDMTDFKSVTKQTTSKDDVRFKKLFRDLKDSDEFHLLKNILSYLLAHRYNAQDRHLEQFFV